MKSIHSLLILAALASSTILAGCEPTSAEVDKKQQDVQTKQAQMAVGMPSVTNFAKRRTLKMAIENQDKMVPTITYVWSQFTGKTFKVCDSIGYPIPAATQYTSPQMREGWDHPVVLPQADPDGTYSPASADATLVSCVGPDKKIHLLTVEDKVWATDFPLNIQEVK
jgi:outer membrane murein-binding lipoprotein Lpp